MLAIAASLMPLVLAAGPAPHAGRWDHPDVASGSAGRYFQITVVDEQTGRGVPLVELRTVHDIRCYTDSSGIVAFHEPGLMGRKVFFHVASHGYELPKDGFGYRGRAIRVAEGGSVRLKIRRINVAERLYRVTGAGIYRDSILVGHAVPVRRPVINGLVLGSDSVVNAVFRGRIYWFWGDTNRPGYPLGNFHVPGATSRLPKDGGLDPELGVNLEYFLDDRGFAKETARMPGEGPTWINGLVTLRDAGGRERLFAAYVKVRKFLEVYQRGLVELDDAKKQFVKVTEFAVDAPAYPYGHPFKHTEGGVEYVYFADPYPLVRARATVEDAKRISRYEAFTCLKEGTRLKDARFDRGPGGRVRYAWKKNTPPVGPKEQARLIKAGKLTAAEALLHLKDVETGRPVTAHRGTVYWNSYRRRWVMITVQVGGDRSFLGEVWYAEADTPTGPWVYARRIITHRKYSFYNPKHHPMFDKDGGRVIFLEGTYTNTFSGNPDRTPRYNYNQVLYKLDLSDERLALPVAVYRLSDGNVPDRFGTVHRAGPPRKGRPIAFFALDRPRKGAAAVYQHPLKAGHAALKLSAPPQAASDAKPAALFYGLPVDARQPPPETMPLYEFVHKDGARRAYSTDPSLKTAGYTRAEQPVCRVWRNPMTGAKR